MNYSELTQAIKDYTENTESTFVANIPNFVRQAEERIFRDITIPELRRNVTGNVNAGNKYVARPDDFLATFSLAIINGTTYTYLLDKEVNFVREAYPDTTVQGLPQYYAIFDESNFLLAPTPNYLTGTTNYTVELHYFYKPESITAASSGTSWLGTNAESTLFYGCLVEAYTFLKGDADVMQMYIARYEDALGKLKNLGENYDTTDSYRSGAVRNIRG